MLSFLKLPKLFFEGEALIQTNPKPSSAKKRKSSSKRNLEKI